MTVNSVRTFVLSATLAVAAAGAASAETIFDMIPSPYPGSFPSLGYQATSTDEFGDHIAFAGVDRDLDNVVVSLTNWSCGNDFDLVMGAWVPNRGPLDACMSTPGTGFVHPITLNIYEVDDTGPDPAVGPLIASKTQPFFIPFRPSFDPMCTPPDMDVPFGGTWFDPVLGVCVHGFAFNITFDFSADGLVLPDEVIYGVAYDTQTHGASPIGAAGPYNSLNFSVDPGPESVGTNPDPDDTFWDTSPAFGGDDTFKRATGWTGFVPVVQFNTPDIGACCTDGPGTESECVEATEGDCVAQGGLYLGDGTDCLQVQDCVPLLVEIESMTARQTAQGVAIAWTTTTEIDTVGFRVLREDGGREKRLHVVGSMLPAVGVGVVGASYEVIDTVRRPIHGTRYWIEDVGIDGKVTRHGPIEVLAGSRTAPR